MSYRRTTVRYGLGAEEPGLFGSIVKGVSAAFTTTASVAEKAMPAATAPATPGAAPAKMSSVQQILDARNKNPILRVVYNPAVVMGVSLAGAYHGYKRSGLGASIGYSVLGSLAPPLAAVIMFAQGFGKPKAKP